MNNRTARKALRALLKMGHQKLAKSVRTLLIRASSGGRTFDPYRVYLLNTEKRFFFVGEAHPKETGDYQEEAKEAVEIVTNLRVKKIRQSGSGGTTFTGTLSNGWTFRVSGD